MSATGTGAPNIEVDQDDVDAFLTRLVPEAASQNKEKPAEQPVKREPERAPQDEPAETEKPDPKETEEPASDEAAGDEETTEETAEETAEPERKMADDGAYVKIKVGDEEHEVPVKDLQRLYGQEAALTKKSMEVADMRKRVDGELATNATLLNSMMERATKRWEPYSKIDFNLAATQLSPEDYTSLRQAAQAAWEDLKFFEQERGNAVQTLVQRQQTTLIEGAKNALKVLSGPEDQGGIEGFDEALYDKIRDFGVSAGMPKEVIDNLVDPVAIKLLNNARLYELGKSKVVTKKINKSPTKVIKTRQAPASAVGGEKTTAAKAMKKLRQSGDTDDAAEALMAGWAARDADQAE